MSRCGDPSRPYRCRRHVRTARSHGRSRARTSRTDMLNLKIIIGSTRPARAADQVISWIVPVARAHGGFDVEVSDLREWDLPIFGETLATVGDYRNPTFSAPVVKRWNSVIAEGDAFLLI